MKKVIVALLIVAIGVIGLVYYRQNNLTITNNGLGTKSTLDYSGRNLTTVPQDIFNNVSITELNLSNNNLTGTIPAEIRKLINLEKLDASNNKMTGIPAEIGQLSKLRIANFANNNITGLPFEIGNLSKLEILDLRGNTNLSQKDVDLIQSKIPNAQILTQYE